MENNDNTQLQNALLDLFRYAKQALNDYTELNGLLNKTSGNNENDLLKIRDCSLGIKGNLEAIKSIIDQYPGLD